MGLLQMKNNKLVLIIGQFSMLLGFLTFLVNYFLLNNNLYLIRRIKEKKE
jgi:hypothetical protein